MGDSSDLDVVVVGAGLAGLTAATRLQHAAARVVALEARAEVGGRTRSHALAGQVFDLGGEFVGPHHRRILRLARELRIPVYRSGLRGAPTLWRLDADHRVGYVPRLSRSELVAAVRAVRGLGRLARTVPPMEPWNAPQAGALDGRSFQQWLEEQGVRGRAFRLFAAMFEGLATTRLDRLSLLHVVWWIARPGGPIAAMRDVNAMRLSGGAQTLCRRLAERIDPPVRLSTPVRRIQQDDAGVTVETGSGETLQARHAIVCTPLPSLAGIEFDPPLDESQDALHRELSFGQATSVVVAPRERQRSRHGLVAGAEDLPLAWRTNGGAKGLFLVDGEEQEPAALVGHLCQAFQFKAESARVEVLRWSKEPFIGGTYVVAQPGQLVRHGPHLRRPHGRVHFAAAERSSWPDSMEGAVESGTCAADRVASSLRR